MAVLCSVVNVEATHEQAKTEMLPKRKPLVMGGWVFNSRYWIISANANVCVCRHAPRAIVEAEEEERAALEAERKKEGDFDTTFRQVDQICTFGACERARGMAGRTRRRVYAL